MSSLRVSVRLSLSFAALGLLLLMVMGLAIQRMVVMQQASTDLAENWLPSVELVNKMNTLTSDFRISEFRHVVSTTDADMARAEQEMADIAKRLASDEAQYVKLISSPQERALYDQFASTWKRYMDLHERMITASRQNHNEEARALLDGESRTAFLANLDFYVQLLTVLAQLFVSGRVIKWIGVGMTLAILPLVSVKSPWKTASSLMKLISCSRAEVMGSVYLPQTGPIP